MNLLHFLPINCSAAPSQLGFLGLERQEKQEIELFLMGEEAAETSEQVCRGFFKKTVEYWRKDEFLVGHCSRPS